MKWVGKSLGSRVPSSVAAFAAGILAPVAVWLSLGMNSESALAEIESPKAPVQLAALVPQEKIQPKQISAEIASQMGYRPVIDSAVESIYNAMSANDLNTALIETDRLLEEFPNFSLGYLLRGDILSLKAGRAIDFIGDVPKLPRSKRDELENLRQEAIARFKAVKDRPNKDLLPSELMVLDSKQAYVILIDTSRSRLFLYENSFPHPRLVTDFYISQGKRGAVKNREGDKRTPIGVYTITELLPKEKLTDFYGPIALPIDYPNAWDKRLGKTGYGIWLHGMPEEYVSRPPKDSDGCVVLANQDLLALQQFVDIGSTMVVISEHLDFVPSDVWQVQRRSALRVVKSWKDDLEKGLSSGLQHYAQNVLIDGQDLISWQKSLGLTEKSFGQIRVNNLNVLRYPIPEGDMMRITFDREDEINGLKQIEQFWMKIGTTWKIVQEQSTNI